MHLYKPVDQDASHTAIDVCTIQVPVLYIKPALQFPHIIVDLIDIFTDKLWIVFVIFVDVSDCRQHLLVTECFTSTDLHGGRRLDLLLLDIHWLQEEYMVIYLQNLTVTTFNLTKLLTKLVQILTSVIIGHYTNITVTTRTLHTIFY